jgi:hypothetical protein
MTSPEDPEAARRRYSEGYEWELKREQEEKRRRRMAIGYGVVVAIASGLLIFFGVAAATKEPAVGVVPGLFAGAVLGVASYRAFSK